MKLKTAILIILLPLAAFSALSDSGYNVYYEIDSLRNVGMKATIFISSSDLVFLRESDSLYRAEYSASMTLLRKDKSPLKSFYSDSSLVFSIYDDTKKDSLIQQTFDVESDTGTRFVSLEVQDKNSSNRFSVLFESLPPRISSSGSYILSASFIGTDDARFFANDTVKLAVRTVISDSEKYSFNLVIENSDRKVVFKKKFAKNSFSEDTLTVSGDFYGGLYKASVELITNGKKIGSLQKDFAVEFSFMNSEKEFNDLLNALSFIAKWDETEKIKKASNEDRERVWNDFWFKQQLHPEISSYVSSYEFFERYGYANKNFTGFKKGYLTDFGRIHMMYGKPDEIERHPFDAESKPYEIWYYWSLGYEFLFVDERGYGEYTLKNYMEQLK